jgi:hypothetical protein
VSRARLATNQHWALLAVRFPFGLWAIGPDMRNLLAAALEDAAAYRRDQPACNSCPTERDDEDLAAIGAAPLRKCGDHLLDDEMAAAYEYALRRIGAFTIEPEDELRAVLARGLAVEDPDGQ